MEGFRSRRAAFGGRTGPLAAFWVSNGACSTGIPFIDQDGRSATRSPPGRAAPIRHRDGAPSSGMAQVAQAWTQAWIRSFGAPLEAAGTGVSGSRPPLRHGATGGTGSVSTRPPGGRQASWPGRGSTFFALRAVDKWC